GRSGRSAPPPAPRGGRWRGDARLPASSRQAPRSTARARSGARGFARRRAGDRPTSAPPCRRSRSRACARDRSGRECRTGRTGSRRMASEWLSPGVAFVEAVPVTDRALAVFPAEVDLAPIAKVREVDEPKAQILGRAAELDDLAEPLLHLGGQALDALEAGAPGSPIDDAAAGQGDPLLLGPQPLPGLARLGVRRHHALHDTSQLRDERLHLGDREVTLSHGWAAPRRSRALPWARARPA